MYSCGPPHIAEQKQDDQLEHTYSICMRIWDVALKTGQRRWPIGRSGVRGSGISVLTARHDDDIYKYKSLRGPSYFKIHPYSFFGPTTTIFIYIYIYILSEYIYIYIERIYIYIYIYIYWANIYIYIYIYIYILSEYIYIYIYIERIYIYIYIYIYWANIYK